MGPKAGKVSILICIAILSNICLGLDEASSRIIGGSLVRKFEKKEYPWIVSLRDESGNHYCGGSLIRGDVILTAAHCLSPHGIYGGVALPEAVVGPRVVSSVKPAQLGESLLAAIHGSWDPTLLSGDLALLFLDKPLPGATEVLKLADTLPENGEKVGIVGWGVMEESSDTPSDRLRHGETSFFDLEFCKQFSLLPDYRLSRGMVCAGNIVSGSIDACKGDSGGPLIHEPSANNTKLTDEQIGIVSWGLGCGRPGLPGVYTDITVYKDWIEWNIEQMDRIKGELTCFSDIPMSEECSLFVDEPQADIGYASYFTDQSCAPKRTVCGGAVNDEPTSTKNKKTKKRRKKSRKHKANVRSLDKILLPPRDGTPQPLAMIQQV